jgi:hypothetical protein
MLSHGGHPPYSLCRAPIFFKPLAANPQIPAQSVHRPPPMFTASDIRPSDILEDPECEEEVVQLPDMPRQGVPGPLSPREHWGGWVRLTSKKVMG